MDIILYLLIGLWLVWIEDKYFAIGSSEVHINGNITAEVNSNDIRLKCSFTLGEGDAFYSTVLTAENATTDTFIEIAGYLRNTKLLFTPFGMDLFGNETTLIHFDKTQNRFEFAFDNVTCRHERRYKCDLYITSSFSFFPTKLESDAIWISVTVPPSKPEMNFPTKVNDLSGGKRNKRSATITPKNDTREQDFIEGDNITFICEGDVGRPEGRFLWQKIYANDEKLTYSNTLTDTIPESCSYDGNSTLTIQVTGDDNQAIIRCIIKSEVSQEPVQEDSEPLRIQFQVRIPVIAMQPDKTVFLEEDSVNLTCQSDGNPSPSYSWLKGYGSNETVIAYTDSFVIENANITDSGLYTCYTNNSIDGKVYNAFNSIYIIIAEKSTSLSTSTLSPVGSDNTKDLLIAVSVCGVALVVVVSFFIVVCICKKRQNSSSKFSKYDINMTKTKVTNDQNKDNDNEVDKQQKDTSNKDNPQKEDTYADPQENVDDKACDRRHKEEKHCEPFDHVDTVQNSSINSTDKVTNFEINQKQKDIYVYVETDRHMKDTYSRDNPQTEDTYADAPDGVYDKPGDRRHIEEKNCEPFDHVDTGQNISAGSNKPTESKESTLMMNRNPKSHNQSKSSGYESVEMDYETPVLLSKSNGNAHADADSVKQHNEKYLQNQKEEDEKGKNSHGSHQHVEYAQVDETKKLKNKSKQNDTDQETVEIHEETTFESEEMHAKTDVHDENFEEAKMTNNEHSDEETGSSVTSGYCMGNTNPAFENDDVSSKDETIKVARVSPLIQMAGPPIEHKQIDATNAESKDRVNLSQTVDDNDDDCNATRNSTSSASSADTKQKENKNAETRQGIHERSDRTVDNAQYFDTASHLESVASSEDTKQKENKNAEARLGINECSGRTVDNAEYFDITTHFEKQHNHNDPETAIKYDQTKSYTNQAFDGEDNQEKDAVSSPVQLLDRLQVDEQNNQNNDKQSNTTTKMSAVPLSPNHQMEKPFDQIFMPF